MPSNVVRDSPVLASDDSSDDEPLIKMKTTPVKKSEKKENTSPRSNGTDKKKNADLKMDDSSDNEPLIKIAKVASKAEKKPFSVPPKKSVDTKKTEALDDADAASSDDEPLTEVAKKVKSQRQVNSPRKANLDMKSKRNAARKKGRCENVEIRTPLKCFSCSTCTKNLFLSVCSS